MKIKQLQLKNFKRVTDLTLQDIPDNAKLVLLIGSNGSGKSSVFDAFELINKTRRGENSIKIQKYYKKNDTDTFEVRFLTDTYEEEQFVTDTDSHVSTANDSYYGRTSFRYIPRLGNRRNSGIQEISLDTDRPKYFIDEDKRFEGDIEIITEEILKEVFRANKSTAEIRERYIDPINIAFEKIFSPFNSPVIKVIEIIPPLENKPAQVLFKKGEAEFSYDLLSAGEKEIFSVLLNLLARKSFHPNSIYYFDEVDLHLNTKLQYNFLKEIIENWIPDNCQFWTASHSLGFIDYANDNKDACILDLDDLDFDKPQVLLPKPKDNLEIFEIAVSKAFIDKVVQGRKIIFSENNDTPFYNDLNIENTFFFVAIDKNDVFHKAKNHKQYGLIDRDYLSDEEIIDIQKTYPFLYILPYYSFESLLYHPNNLEDYYKKKGKAFDKEKYISNLRNIKNNERDYLAAGIIQARSGYPFYKENENAKSLKSFKENYRGVIELLRSDEFEQFYKVFPAKDYGKELLERQNIPLPELTKTKWFKHQIESILNNKA